MALTLVGRRPAGASERLLLLLPGFGDEPALLLDQLPVLDPERRWHVAVARPRVETDDGPAWFTVGPDGPDAAQLAASVAAVDEAAGRLLDEAGAPADALVIAGYSQGGALALATLLDPTVTHRPGAAAALAGYLPHRDADQDAALAAGRRVLVAHGADDDVVDPLLGRGAARALERAGADVTWSEVEGDHRLRAPLVDALRGWLEALRPA